MFICQTVNSDRFLETLFCTLFIHKSTVVRLFEYAANSTGGERLRREGKTGDIILLNES